MDILSTIPLGIEDIINAAVLAVIIVVVFRLLGWGFRAVIARTRYINFDPARADEVKRRCTTLFPIEYLQFNGITFKRGTLIRIITHQQAAIEGEFLGTNRSNMLCLVTHESVIAQELQNIETIQIIGKPLGSV
jgi:hypothetical protein